MVQRVQDLCLHTIDSESCVEEVHDCEQLSKDVLQREMSAVVVAHCSSIYLVNRQIAAVHFTQVECAD